MCLGIPGRVVAATEHADLVLVDVFGVERRINTGLLEGEQVVPGDWVLIHVGFVLSKLDAEEARMATESLRMVGSSPVPASAPWNEPAGGDAGAPEAGSIEAGFIEAWTKEEAAQWAS